MRGGVVDREREKLDGENGDDVIAGLRAPPPGDLPRRFVYLLLVF